jgi:hypothetical protein
MFGGGLRRRWSAVLCVLGLLLGALALFARPALAQTNPPLPARCGLRVAVVLDMSSSLSADDVAQAKRAAHGVVSGLAGTPSSVGLYTFASYAPDRTNQPLAATSVAEESGAGTVDAAIDDLRRVPASVGGTNWDRGLAQVGSDYDLVLFVTDGRPTAYGVPGQQGNRDLGTRTDAIDLERAETSAAALQAAGTRIVALGVGESVAAENLRLVSGPDAGSDYHLVGDYEDLPATLQEAALGNCAQPEPSASAAPSTTAPAPETTVPTVPVPPVPSPEPSATAPSPTAGPDPSSSPAATSSAVPSGAPTPSGTPTPGVTTAPGATPGDPCPSVPDSGQSPGSGGDPEVMGTGSVSWCLLDMGATDTADPGWLLDGSAWRLTGPDGTFAIVEDNGANDYDPTPGRIRVGVLADGEYTIMQMRAPAGYLIHANPGILRVQGNQAVEGFTFEPLFNIPLG